MPSSNKDNFSASVMDFGMIDERRTGFGTPYKFNGKELDCESGYYYYVNELVEDIEMSSERVKRSTSPAVPSIRDEERMRSRYYDPRMSRFLSVDPLASDMPAWGSYTYTFDNPIRLVDPTGMRPEEPPYLFDGLYWEDEDGVFTRDNINQNWTWTDSEGDFRGTYPSGTVPSGSTQSVGIVESAFVFAEGVLFEAGKALGLDSESAAIAATTVFVVNDLKNLRVKKVIKGVDDLLDAAGNFKNRGSGTKTLQGNNRIEGSMNETFESLTEGFESTFGGAKIHPDGRIISKHISENGPTISVFQKGQLEKK